MNNSEHTKADKMVRWVKNHRIMSLVVFIGIVVIALSSFTESVRNLTKQVTGMFSKDTIRVYAAVYAYERGDVFDGAYKTYYYEMRNLATNCSLWRAEIKNLQRGRSVTPTPSAQIILKLFLENPSETPLSNLRIGLRGLPFQFDKIFCTPNIECLMKGEATSNEALSTQVILVPSIAPAGKAVISLEAPV